MDSLGKRRHDAVGLSVGTGDARGNQNAEQNVWSGQHRCGIQTSKEEHGVIQGLVQNVRVSLGMLHLRQPGGFMLS